VLHFPFNISDVMLYVTNSNLTPAPFLEAGFFVQAAQITLINVGKSMMNTNQKVR